MVQIRAASGEQAALLSALALRSKAHWGYSDSELAAFREELTYAPEVVEAGGFWILADQDAVAGFCALEKVSPGTIELEALFIEPDAIGHGHGRTLIEHAIAECARAGIERLVIQSDPQAAGFYERVGARCIGTRPSGSIEGRLLPLYEIDIPRVSNQPGSGQPSSDRSTS